MTMSFDLNEFDNFDILAGVKVFNKKKLEVKVGNVLIGGDAPVVVQSMTSGSRTNPSDAKIIANDEFKEIKELAEAGSEIVRIALNSEKAAEAIPYIKEEMQKHGIYIPIVGCGQYEISELVKKLPTEVAMLEKLRINPGNIGFGNKRDAKFETVIEYACKHNMPVRIGVNWGSLDKNLAQKLMDDNVLTQHSSEVILRKALVLSALLSARKAEEIGLPSNKIVISCKVSRVEDLLLVYRFLHINCEYPLHLGLTEAGMGRDAVISTAIGVGILLNEYIGNTIRASLTPKVGEKRSNEVMVSQAILQALDRRSFAPKVTSCPGCGRTSGNYFQHLTEQVQKYIELQMSQWKTKYKGVENLKIAVMGCVVNGPGESKHANIGISLPGYGEVPVAAVFVDGVMYKKLTGDDIYSQFIEIIDGYVRSKYETV